MKGIWLQVGVSALVLWWLGGTQAVVVIGGLLLGWYVFFGPFILYAAKAGRSWEEAFAQTLAAPWYVMRWALTFGAVVLLAMLFGGSWPDEMGTLF